MSCSNCCFTWLARWHGRSHALHDANWNVVALCNTSSTILERISYNVFGKPSWLDVNHGPKTTSGYAWNRTFTGQVFDSETGLMLYRNRFYHPGLGRFVRRDPIGYRAKDVNVYRYVSNRPIGLFDPSGMAWTVPQYFHWYYTGGGQTITLSFTGLLNDYMNATKSEREMQVKNEVSDKFSLNCDNPTQTISGTMYMKTAVGGDLLDPLTVLGNSHYKATYSCTSTIACKCCKGEVVPTKQDTTCTVIFHFKDRFANPLDWGGPFYEKNEELYKACQQDCNTRYKCSGIAWTYKAKRERYKCIQSRNFCLSECNVLHPRSEFPGAYPYDIEETFSSQYSWTKQLDSCD